MQNLSLRLNTIASLVPNGARVCDIGTDHAYLAIYLKKSGKAQSVIATDINEKPLKNAEKNIELSGVSGIKLRLSDGLSEIKQGDADTIIIAGMGGEVIAGILERGKNIAATSGISLILQPTTSPEALREFLCLNGYEIIKEIPLEENSKLYSIMLVKYTGNTLTPKEVFYFVGKILPDTEFGFKYIKKQQNRFLKCAEQLKNVSYKHNEYLHYTSLIEYINKLLGENNGF